ncbi:MAG: large-conductance mechanosensitive channel protein MscL [Flavobacteriales bacterium]|nr:large-conductance mechanosensitive channel protein MscL [Flavobacteriales bacterium]
MLKEFKTFISKGNVMEMAVGLIMATYFGAIVKSLVNDILMPPIGKMMGGVDFAELKLVIQDAIPAVMEGEMIVTEEVAEVAIMYGNFINTIITFLIVAFCIFMVVKAYNKMKERMEKKEEEAPATPPAPSKEEVLLTEIRDLLKNK